MQEVSAALGDTTDPVTDLVRRADELERDGRWADAIDLLATANRAQRADELELALADLRRRSFTPLAAEAPSLDAPPRDAASPGLEPSLGPSGLAEISLAELSEPVLSAAIQGHGALLVRRAIPPELAHNWAADIDRCLEQREATRADPAHRSSWWRPLPVDDEAAEHGLARKWIRAGGGTLLVDSPRLLAALLDLYEHLGLRTVVAEYLGGRPVLSANKCTLRRVELDATGGWHQDGAFLGQHVRALNLWLALTPCGVDAPGLDLVPHRFDEIVETGTVGSHFDWAVGSDVISNVSGEVGVVRPRFDAGDLLLFDEWFLHRTAVDPAMTRARHAIESWCFAPSAYPHGHVPLVW